MCSYVAERFRCIFGCFVSWNLWGIPPGSTPAWSLSPKFAVSPGNSWNGWHQPFTAEDGVWWGTFGGFRTASSRRGTIWCPLITFTFVPTWESQKLEMSILRKQFVGPTGLRFWPMAASPSHISEDHHGTHQHLPVWVQSWNSHRILMNFGELVILEKKIMNHQFASRNQTWQWKTFCGSGISWLAMLDYRPLRTEKKKNAQNSSISTPSMTNHGTNLWVLWLDESPCLARSTKHFHGHQNGCGSHLGYGW